MRLEILFVHKVVAHESELLFGEPVNLTYSAANRLATYNGEAVSFDADGNMTFGPVYGSMVNFEFDSRNRLLSAGGRTYRYNAENQLLGVNHTEQA